MNKPRKSSRQDENYLDKWFSAAASLEEGLEALVDFPREEALDFLELEVSPGLEDSLELEESEDGQELEAIPHRVVKEDIPHKEVREAILRKEVREAIHHKEAREAIPRKEVREAIPHKEVKEVIPHREVKEVIHRKEVKEDPRHRVHHLLLLLVVDLIPQHLSQPLRSPPHPRAPLDPAPPTLTPAVLANITPSGTTRTAPWPRSRRGSTTTTSTRSRWSTGGRQTRASGPGLPPCFRMADSSAAAPSSPGSTSSPPPTVWLSKSVIRHQDLC